ncbi:hypothetical protein HII28_02230 [Planctomonas sp. JC2975]|uniref:hypothetical protein n=1 Tax=Planctomonas sp. JC2975 TaxID=2729626 RepID=UPI001475D26B|nr:hypothetical protein [Planctomonas sp. JC2975]NNC10705.1 hypothetical protein [Planctomonas sp. JC2975]
MSDPTIQVPAGQDATQYPADAPLPVSNQDPAAVAAAIADPDNGITKEPATPVGIKIDPTSAQEIGQHIADAINSTAGQTIEGEIVDSLSGAPKWLRGTIYGGIGAIGTLGGSILGYAATNPGILPGWLVVTAGILTAPSVALVGSTGFANLGKK